MPSIDDHGLRRHLNHGGQITLILGAGVSVTRGVPRWKDLLRQTWQAAFGKDPHAADEALLARTREAARRAGVPEDFLEQLTLDRHPLETQLAFEQIYAAARWDDEAVDRLRRKSGASTEAVIAKMFARRLQTLLYREAGRARRPRVDTLGLVARAVRRSARLPARERPIPQVITFNVDDLLEWEVHRGTGRRTPLAVPIFRPSDVRPLDGPIPIYHLHGFIPRRMRVYPEFLWKYEKAPPEALVFTDEQYWRSMSIANGYASRIFAGALAGHCVFIGLSMTDLNIMRWLALDAAERGDDFRKRAADDSSWASLTEFDFLEDMSRHYWITKGPTGYRAEYEAPGYEDVLENALRRRGVQCIRIGRYDSPPFQRWWEKCFFPEGNGDQGDRPVTRLKRPRRRRSRRK